MGVLDVENENGIFRLTGQERERKKNVLAEAIIEMIVLAVERRRKESARKIREHTLQPSQVKAPKWKPAAGSPHTLHSWFICKDYTHKQKRERDR